MPDKTHISRFDLTRRDLWNEIALIPGTLLLVVVIVVACVVILSICFLIDMATGNKGEKITYFDPKKGIEP